MRPSVHGLFSTVNSVPQLNNSHASVLQSMTFTNIEQFMGPFAWFSSSLAVNKVRIVEIHLDPSPTFERSPGSCLSKCTIHE